MTGRRSNPFALDASRFVGTAAHELAVVVHKETEAKRAAESLEFKKKHADDPPSKNPLQFGYPYDPNFSKQWFEYLTGLDVLERCQQALGTGGGELATRIVSELRPENWQVFFWIGSWYDVQAKLVDEIVETEMLLEEKVEEFERQKREFAKAGAVARHAPLAAVKAFVIKEWRKNRVAYDTNKSAFARDYVRRVKNEYELEVTHKTISGTWLKGL